MPFLSFNFNFNTLTHIKYLFISNALYVHSKIHHPATLLLVSSILVPLVIVVLISYICTTGGNDNSRHRLRMYHTIHAAVCGLMTAICISEITTNTIKLYVRRKRPNFYALCGFDIQQLKCTATPDSQIKEATFSFPSGHSSLACTGMTYLVWFLLATILIVTPSSRIILPCCRNNNNNISRRRDKLSTATCSIQKRFLCVFVCIIPWGYAVWVGTSRIVDYWHHPSDVIAGLLLGLFTGTVSFHVWFNIFPINISRQKQQQFIMPWSLYNYNLQQVQLEFGGNSSSSGIRKAELAP